MATKRVQFFCTPSDFVSIIASIAVDLRLSVIKVKENKGLYRAFKIPPNELSHSTSDMFFLCSSDYWSTVTCKEFLNGFLPAQLGWILVEPPLLEDQRLYMASLAVKSDWYDSACNEICDNKKLLRLYNSVIGQLKKHLKFPVWAINIKTMGSHRYNDTGYTENVSSLIARNKTSLMQFGTENVRYFLTDPKH